MKLNDLDKKNVASRALKEGFSYTFNPNNLDKSTTRNMLTKVRGLLTESKKSPNFYRNQTNPTHMKLVFMEQALNSHIRYLNSMPRPRIVVENEEVEKSQVILAAQDMVDSVQKMVEDVSDMLVKELPALVDSVQSEIGVQESEEFNTQVSEALSSLNSALQQSKTTLQSALNSITGQASGDFGMDDGLQGDMDSGLDGAEDDMDMDMDVDSDLGNDLPSPEAEPSMDEPEPKFAGAGRPKR